MAGPLLYVTGLARVSTATSELVSRGRVGNRGSPAQLGCSRAAAIPRLWRSWVPRLSLVPSSTRPIVELSTKLHEVFTMLREGALSQFRIY